MPSLTYVKGLPTPAGELNALGFTEFEMFLEVFAPIFRDAAIETVNHLLSGAQFNKSAWNTHLQNTYQLNKRHANGVIAYAKGKVDGEKEHRTLHIKTLEGKAKSILTWIKKAERSSKLARKFYGKKNWQNSKTGGNFPLSCSLKHKNTNWQNLKFQLHGKKRKLHLIQSKLEFLKTKPVRVSVLHDQVFIVGSSTESFGNQVAQWDGKILKFRVPACLESRLGKYVSSEIGNYERNINRLPEAGSKTWHLFKKEVWTNYLALGSSVHKFRSGYFDFGNLV